MDSEPFGKRLDGVGSVIHVKEKKIEKIDNQNNFRNDIMVLGAKEVDPKRVEQVKNGKVPGDSSDVLDNGRVSRVVLKEEKKLVKCHEHPVDHNNKAIGCEWSIMNMESWGMVTKTSSCVPNSKENGNDKGDDGEGSMCENGARMRFSHFFYWN